MQIVKVKYNGEGREYSYFSEETLQVGDKVTVPTKYGSSYAIVSAIDQPEESIAAFRDAIRTIPAGAIVKEEKESVITKVTLTAEIPVEDIFTTYAPEGATTSDEFQPTAVIVIQPEISPGFLALKESLASLKQYAELRVIATEKDLMPATQDLTVIAGCKKDLETLRDKFVKPIRAHLDAVMAPFKELAQLLVDAELTNKQKITIFNQAQAARAAEIEKINREAEELARKQAELSGTGEFTVDTTPIPVPVPVKHIFTGNGTASMINAPATWELEDWDKVPKEFKMLDSTRIGKVIRAGGSIPGIKRIQNTTVRTTVRS